MGKRSNRKNMRRGKDPLNSSQGNPPPPSSSSQRTPPPPFSSTSTTSRNPPLNPSQGNPPPPSSSTSTPSRNQPPPPPTPSSPSSSPIPTPACVAFELHDRNKEVIKIPSKKRTIRPRNEVLKSSQGNPPPPSSSSQRTPSPPFSSTSTTSRNPPLNPSPGNPPPPSSSTSTPSRNQPPPPPTPSSPSSSPIPTPACVAFELHDRNKEVIKIPSKKRTIRPRNEVLKSSQGNPPPPSSSSQRTPPPPFSSTSTTSRNPPLNPSQGNPPPPSSSTSTPSRNQSPSPPTPSSPSSSLIPTPARVAFDLHDRNKEVIKIPSKKRTIRPRNEVLKSSQGNPPLPLSSATTTSRNQPPRPPTPSSPSASDDEKPDTSAVREEKKITRKDVRLALALESIQAETVTVGEGLGNVIRILGMGDPAAKLVQDYISNDLSLKEVMEQIRAAMILQRRSNLETAVQDARKALSDIRTGRVTLEQGTGDLRLNLNGYDSTLSIVERVSKRKLSVEEASEELKAIAKKRSGGAL